jgi:1,4-alpha-glucan branching enzyme
MTTTSDDAVKTPASPHTVAITPAADCAITDFDTYLFRQGNHFKLYKKFGAHIVTNAEGVTGVQFVVWAPNAKRVSVVGDFNGWNAEANPLLLPDRRIGHLGGLRGRARGGQPL